MMPPMMVRISIHEQGQKKFNLWFPLILAYLFLLPVVILLSPVLLLVGVAFWMARGVNPFSATYWFYELWCATKGTIIEATNKGEHVLVQIS